MDNKQNMVGIALIGLLFIVVIIIKLNDNTQILKKMQKQNTEILTLIKASTQPTSQPVTTSQPIHPKHP